MTTEEMAGLVASGAVVVATDGVLRVVSSPGVGTVVGAESEVVNSVWHATPTPGAARSILENGIDPAFMSANSRFGRGFYIAEQPETSLAELAHHGVEPSTGIRFSINQDALRMLDLTDPNIASVWGYSGGPISSSTQAIGARAAQSGYNAIRYSSEQAAGTNIVVIQNFNDVLRPLMVSPIVP
jgi:filamentous hemagglutinin